MRVLVVCLALVAAPAAAQSISLSPPEPARWDASGSLGWFSGNKSGLAQQWNEWYDTLAASVDVGRYLTPNLKAEVGATFTTEGSVYSETQVRVPGQPFPIFIPREHHFRVNAANVGAAYQFFDNQWVHPFVGAGVQLGWEHERGERATFDARPFAGGGAKFYVNERGFVRADVNVGWSRGGVAQVSWRGGVGVDF